MASCLSNGPPQVAENDQEMDNPFSVNGDWIQHWGKISDTLKAAPVPTDSDSSEMDATYVGKTSHALRSAAQFSGGDCPHLIHSISSVGSIVLLSIGSHYFYVDGSPRTLLRGWLHGTLCTMVLPIALLALTFALLLEELPLRWLTAEIFLAGKFASYVTSSALHLFPFQTKEGERLARRIDMALIPVSIAVSPCPFTVQLDECVISLAVHAVFVVLGVIVIMRRLLYARLALIIIQFIVAIFVVGLHTGFTSPMWITGVTAYSLGFVAFSMTLSLVPKCAMPWHRLDWYGWHDDFHVFLFIGDLMTAVKGAHLLSDPSQDQNPHWWFDE